MTYVRFIKLAKVTLAALTLNLIGFPTTAELAPLKRYIIVFKSNVAPVDTAVAHAILYRINVDYTYESAIKGYAAFIPQASIPAIKNDPRVLFVSEDRPVYATAQTLPTGVDRIEGDLSSANGDGTGTSSYPGVAIIDTGISSDAPTKHPDLNVKGGTNCLTGIPLPIGYNDQNGHGTHVAGTVAGKDDTQGVVGVAPGAPLYAVQVLGPTGAGTTASVICGIDWVTKNAASKGIKVVNMSLGGTGSDDGNCGMTNNDAMHVAICNSEKAGITYVVAAGNSGEDFANTTPAAYNEVLTVTAAADYDGKPGGVAASTCRAGVDDKLADFSNFTTIGSPDVDHTIAAPGVCINSTWLNKGYNTISGTSMASPHVAGVVALCIASGPCAGKTPKQIISEMRSHAAAQPLSYGFQGDPNSPDGNKYYGHLVNAGKY